MSEDNKSSGGIVLLSTEVELYVQALQAFPIEEIGSKRWSSQREMLEKLNMQAILSATQNETEYVKDSFVTYEKVAFFAFWKLLIPQNILLEYKCIKNRCLC